MRNILVFIKNMTMSHQKRSYKTSQYCDKSKQYRLAQRLVINALILKLDTSNNCRLGQLGSWEKRVNTHGTSRSVFESNPNCTKYERCWVLAQLEKVALSVHQINNKCLIGSIHKSKFADSIKPWHKNWWASLQLERIKTSRVSTTF